MIQRIQKALRIMTSMYFTGIEVASCGSVHKEAICNGMIRTEKNSFTIHYISENEDVPPNAGIRFIYEDRQGDLWLGVKAFHMALGGNGLYHINRQTGKIKHYKHQPGIAGSLSSNGVTCFYEEGKAFFG